MSNLISGFCFIQAAKRCLGFIALVGLVAAAHAEEPDGYFFAPRYNLLTTQFVHSGADLVPSYRVSASVVLTRPADYAPTDSGLDGAFHLPPAVKPQQETALPTNSRWQQTYDGDRISLQRLLSVELKGEKVNTIFRPRSILVEGERFKVTFRSQSALIEGKRLKVMLQPHSASMQWSNSF